MELSGAALHLWGGLETCSGLLTRPCADYQSARRIPSCPTSRPIIGSRAIVRTDLCDTGHVKGSEFLRKLQRLARRRRIRFQYDPGLGKGSHGRVWFEAASTTLKDPKKELGTGLLRAMCHDLGIEPRDL